MIKFEQLTTKKIELEIGSNAVEFQVILKCPMTGYKWVYPVIIYEVHVHKIKPIMVTGVAGKISVAKLYPCKATSISTVELAFDR